MINKHDHMRKYRGNIIKSLKQIVTILNSDKNMLFINVVSKYSKQYLYSNLNSNGFSYYILSKENLNKFGSLGGYLRSLTHNENTILILDFSEELNYMCEDIFNLVETININRDIFTKSFNNVIFISNPSLTKLISIKANDFWNSIDYYLDMEKWFCTPTFPPIVKIRILQNDFLALSLAKKEDIDIYKKYIDLKIEIQNIEKYEENQFENIFTRIKNLSNHSCYYDLTNSFINYLLSVRTNKYTYEQKLQQLEKTLEELNISIITIDSFIMVAEFYYNIGYYDYAVKTYQKVIHCLNEEWDNIEKDQVISFVQCNIVICKFLKGDSYYSESNLIDELKLRFDNTKYSLRKMEFQNLYFTLIELCSKHHSRIQHSEYYRKLQHFKTFKLGVLDLEEAYHIVYSWEKFINSSFYESELLNDISIQSNIHYLMQEMINLFCYDSYSMAKKKYKKAKYICNNNGYNATSTLLDIIIKNMFYLYKKSNYID